MGMALGYPEGQVILPSLPISDMSTGVLGAVTAMSMLRDRARLGGSYHGAVSLTAYNCATLHKDFGLYQPSVVKQIQDKYKFKKITSDIHVIELYYDIAQAWKDNSDLISNEDYYVHFDDSVYGKDIRILRPLVQYSSKETTPRWTSPPVPFCHHKEVSW
jgi:methyl coenzyme M reductase alpha subunit